MGALGFYGMQALIVYYMVQRLNFPDERAALVTGRRVGADLRGSRHWRLGERPGSRHAPHDAVGRGGPGHRLRVDGGARRQRVVPVLLLGVIVVGNGLFKANTGNLVRKIYEGDDSRIDSAFTIYYMAVNGRDDLAAADPLAQGLRQ